MVFGFEIDMAKFKIFISKRKNRLTRGLVIKWLALIFIFLFFLSAILKGENDLNDWQKVLGIFGGGLFLLGIVLKFYGMFNYENLKGEFKGFLEFKNDGIFIDEKFYEVTNIKNIEIINEDYKGKLILKSRLDFDNSLSNGVDNLLRFSTINPVENIEVSFQQNEKSELKQALVPLIKYHQLGKISFLKLLDSLNISDYDEIQTFKASINRI